MYNIIIYKFIFLIVSSYLGLKAIAYSLYEIKQENNKYGGITVFAFSVLVVIFVNILIWIR